MEELVNGLVVQLRDSIRSHTSSEDENAVSSHPLKNVRASTICFCKTPVLRLRRIRSVLRVEIKTEFVPDFGLADYVSPSKEKGWSLADYRQFIIDRLIETAHVVYAKCSIEEQIGCCSQYIECSDARHCIKPDVPWAGGCMYRENLSRGRIFYGKNRNIR